MKSLILTQTYCTLIVTKDNLMLVTPNLFSVSLQASVAAIYFASIVDGATRF